MAFKAPPHCPRLQGLLASRVKNNAGLGLNQIPETAKAHLLSLVSENVSSLHRDLTSLYLAQQSRNQKLGISPAKAPRPQRSEITVKIIDENFYLSL